MGCQKMRGLLFVTHKFENPTPTCRVPRVPMGPMGGSTGRRCPGMHRPLRSKGGERRPGRAHDVHMMRQLRKKRTRRARRQTHTKSQTATAERPCHSGYVPPLPRTHTHAPHAREL